MQNNFNISIFVDETELAMNKEFYKYFFFLLILINIFFVNITAIYANAVNKDNKLEIIVIDAGHGGKDAGATVQGIKEKDIVLNIALMLGDYINKNFPEIKVIYTRDKDIFVPLYKRAEIANKNKAGLFISIHANYEGSYSVAGTETFVLGQHRSQDNLEVAKKENSVILLEDNYSTKYEGFDPNSSESYIMFEMIQSEYLDQSLEFAAEVQDQFKNRAKRIDRGVKQAGFLVLRETTMPSVLVEVGFISHKSERNYLESDQGKTYLASAIYRSFKQYKEKIEKRSNFNLNVLAEEPPEELAENDEEDSQPEEFVFENNIWFSVQIAASQKSLDTSPSNFKGEKSIYKKKFDEIYKYYSGQFATNELAEKEKIRLKSKYPDAFVVAFESDNPVSVKKAIRKIK